MATSWKGLPPSEGKKKQIYLFEYFMILHSKLFLLIYQLKIN